MLRLIHYSFSVGSLINKMPKLKTCMKILEKGINSTKGPPVDWSNLVEVFEEAILLGEMAPGTAYPIRLSLRNSGDTGGTRRCLLSLTLARLQEPRTANCVSRWLRRSLSGAWQRRRNIVTYAGAS